MIFLLATITGTCQRTSKSNLKIKPKYADLITKPKIKLPPKFISILSHLWLCDVILRSGDVHPNPGPRPAGPPIFPCGTCQRSVKNRDKAIICDECNLWYHINCVGISPSTYHSLIHQDQSAHWFCERYGIPNYTPTFSSDEQSTSYTDSYELNNAIFYDHDNEEPTFGPNPQNASTPERQKRTQGNSLKGILINTNSVKSIEKATQLKATIHYSNKDIIFLVETKLDSNYQTYSFLPPNYVAIRKDRNAHGGGVLIAFRDDITAESLDNLNSNCEIVWTKIRFARNKSIFFASYYRPPSDHLASLSSSSIQHSQFRTTIVPLWEKLCRLGEYLFIREWKLSNPPVWTAIVSFFVAAMMFGSRMTFFNWARAGDFGVNCSFFLGQSSTSGGWSH